MTAGADQLEALLGHLEVLSTVRLLSDSRVHNSLYNIFLGCGGFHISNQVVGIIY
jgi:hypothetical protein